MADDVHALAAAYALDALDPEERRRFESHYPDCDACRIEVDQFRETVAHLGAAAPSTLPGHLKARVLAEVGQTPQLPPIVTPGPKRQWLRPVLAVAAVVILVLGLAGVLYARHGSTTEDAGRELSQVLAAPDTQTIKLEGTGQGTLRVVYSQEEGKAVLVGAGLPSAGPDRTYQLWSVNGTTVSSAGVFEPTPAGRVAAVVAAPAVPADLWGVSIEPAGGSPSATGKMIYQSTT
jgi:anti-sigma-K factor RskA